MQIYLNTIDYQKGWNVIHHYNELKRNHKIKTNHSEKEWTCVPVKKNDPMWKMVQDLVKNYAQKSGRRFFRNDYEGYHGVYNMVKLISEKPDGAISEEHFKVSYVATNGIEGHETFNGANRIEHLLTVNLVNSKK